MRGGKVFSARANISIIFYPRRRLLAPNYALRLYQHGKSFCAPFTRKAQTSARSASSIDHIKVLSSIIVVSALYACRCHSGASIFFLSASHVECGDLAWCVIFIFQRHKSFVFASAFLFVYLLRHSLSSLNVFGFQLGSVFNSCSFRSSGGCRGSMMTVGVGVASCISSRRTPLVNSKFPA